MQMIQNPCLSKVTVKCPSKVFNAKIITIIKQYKRKSIVCFTLFSYTKNSASQLHYVATQIKFHI